MNAFSIKFNNLARADDGPSPEQTQSQFTVFCLLCASRGATEYVKEVEFSRHSCCFHVELTDDAKGSHTIAALLTWCASQSLSQFEIDGGPIGHKDTESSEIDCIAIVLPLMAAALAEALAYCQCHTAQELAEKLDAQAKRDGVSQRVIDLDTVLTELSALGRAGTEGGAA